MGLEGNTQRTRASQWLLIPSAVLTIVLLGTGLYLALAPYLVFHSMDRYRYEWYHAAAPVVAALSLISANVWVGSIVVPRAHRAEWGRTRSWRVMVVVAGMLVGTLIAAVLLYFVFALIYLSTVNWFVF